MKRTRQQRSALWGRCVGRRGESDIWGDTGAALAESAGPWRGVAAARRDFQESSGVWCEEAGGALRLGSAWTDTDPDREPGPDPGPAPGLLRSLQPRHATTLSAWLEAWPLCRSRGPGAPMNARGATREGPAATTQASMARVPGAAEARAGRTSAASGPASVYSSKLPAIALRAH